MDAAFEAIRVGLRRLQAFSIEPEDRPAETHRYRLNPPLAEDEARRFETEHRIALPPEYRGFLTLLGNGGAGPGCGLEMLGCARGATWDESPGLVGDLSLIPRRGGPSPSTRLCRPMSNTASRMTTGVRGT